MIYEEHSKCSIILYHVVGIFYAIVCKNKKHEMLQFYSKNNIIFFNYLSACPERIHFIIYT